MRANQKILWIFVGGILQYSRFSAKRTNRGIYIQDAKGVKGTIVAQRARRTYTLHGILTTLAGYQRLLNAQS